MIQNNDFDKKLLEKIKEEKIIPKSKWEFILKNYAVWITGILSIAFGAISFSLIIDMSEFDGWETYGRLRPFKFLLFSIPFFWIIFLVAFIFVIYYNFKKTKNGYRYSTPIILLVSLIISGFLGIIVHFVGLGQKIDDVLSERAPFYGRIINPHMRFWSETKEGRLAGMVTSVNENTFTVLDELRKEWKVYAKNQNNDKMNEVRVGYPTRFIGKKISDNEFEAGKIMPMRSGRGYFNSFKKRFGHQDDERGNRMRVEKGENFLKFLEKYPELKSIFIGSLLENKEKIQELIKNNPKLLEDLTGLNIDSESIKKLEEKQ